MKIIRKIALSVALLLLASSLFLANYFIDQSKTYDAERRSLDTYIVIGTSKSLDREVITERISNKGEKAVTSIGPAASSQIETEIFLQVRERLANKQTIRIFTFIRNNSWIHKSIINELDVNVFEVFEAIPSSEQLRGMVFNTKQKSENLTALTLWPRQSYQSYADFELPFPINTDLTVNSFLIENGSNRHSIKTISNSVLMRASDLNAAPVK